MTTITKTNRLKLRHFNYNDVSFIVKLLNEPSFIKNIADKGVRTIDDVLKYLQDGPMVSYQKFGFGLSMIELEDSATLLLPLECVD